MSKKNSPSQITEEQAMAIAKGTQKPGQTKEQTKLIAQGISHGIHLFKQQEKAKARERDKARKKQQKDKVVEIQPESSAKPQSSSILKVLPWALLLISWCLFAVFFLLE